MAEESNYSCKLGTDTNGTVRILVVDDFAEWRACVRLLLEPRPNYQVIAEACDGLQAVQKSIELCPDIVLLDVGMPLLNGLEAARRIRLSSPSSKMIFVTQNDDAVIRAEALATGAEEYVLKANAESELIPAIGAALKDGHCPDAPF